jgi:hypothetical protein
MRLAVSTETSTSGSIEAFNFPKFTRKLPNAEHQALAIQQD